MTDFCLKVAQRLYNDIMILTYPVSQNWFKVKIDGSRSALFINNLDYN